MVGAARSNIGDLWSIRDPPDRPIVQVIVHPPLSSYTPFNVNDTIVSTFTMADTHLTVQTGSQIFLSSSISHDQSSLVLCMYVLWRGLELVKVLLCFFFLHTLSKSWWRILGLVFLIMIKLAFSVAAPNVLKKLDKCLSAIPKRRKRTHDYTVQQGISLAKWSRDWSPGYS